MLTLKRTARRGIAAGVAGLLAASTAAVLAAPAQAANPLEVTDGTAVWGISEYLADGRFGRPKVLEDQADAPASWNADAKQATWGAGAGAINADGSADLSFDGSIVLFAGTSGATIYLNDLEADLDAAGNGSVTAEVSYGSSAIGAAPMIEYDPNLKIDRGPQRVEIVELTGNTADQITAGAAETVWTNLSASGWSADLVDFVAGDATVDPEIPAYSYGEAAFNNPALDRQPLAFDFSVKTAPLSPKVAVEANEARDSFTVTGTNFFGGDANRKGIYVGIAPSGGIPDTSVEPEDQLGGFIATAPPIMDIPTLRTEFTQVLDVNFDNPELVILPGVEYSVYTWQAHIHSSNELDTETPIGVLKDVVDSTTSVKVARQAAQRKITVTATVKGHNPTGNVTLAIAGGKDKRSRTVAVNAAGVATWTFTKLSNVGQYSVDAAYAGDAANKASKATARFAMPKIKTTTKVNKLQHAKKAKAFKQIRVRARVTQPVSGKTPGKVKIVIKRGKKNVHVVKNVKLNKKGAVNRVIKGLGKKINKKGKYRVVVQYQGGKQYTKANGGKNFRLK